jgi:hypothetical protein
MHKLEFSMICQRCCCSVLRIVNLLIVSMTIVISACANPSVNTSTPSFDENQYTLDLDLCRGGTALNTALSGVGGAIIGSACGAIHGVYYGALSGDAPEGALIGAIAGGVVGVFAGAYEPFQEKDRSVHQCLSSKGYSLQS